MVREKICGIYKIENLVNGKVYIGLSNNIEQRWKCHVVDLNGNRHDNQYLQNSWNKYGKNNFSFEIIEECDINLLPKREEYYIFEYNACNRDKGYNMNFGGEFRLHTEEVKKKISEKHKGKVLSDATKLKISKANVGKQLNENHPFLLLDRNGENNPMYGVHRFGKESPHFGMKHSYESKKKMSDNMKGRTPWNKGLFSLSEDDVISIRVLLKYSILKQSEIAEIFKTNQKKVSLINTNKVLEYIDINDLSEDRIKEILKKYINDVKLK